MQEKAEHVISRRTSNIDKQILRRKLSIYQVTLLERGVEASIPKHVRYSFSGCLKFFLVHDGEAIPVNIDTTWIQACCGSRAKQQNQHRWQSLLIK